MAKIGIPAQQEQGLAIEFFYWNNLELGQRITLSNDDAAKVEELVSKAISAGGSKYAEPKDYGFMYQNSFQDPDGHQWELIHMSAMPTA